MNRKLVKNPFVFSSIFTILSLYLHRYSYGTGDQAVHIALINKIINPNLYPNDLLFTAGQQDLSFFYKIVAFLVIFFNSSTEVVFFVGYVIFSLLFYLSLYYLGMLFFNRKIFALILLNLFFLVPLPVGGSAIMTLETSFVPRMVSFILSIWSIYFFLNKKYLISTIILPLIFAIHPISFLYIFLILFSISIYNKHRIPLKYFILLITIFTLVNFSLLNSFLIFLNPNLMIGEKTEWISILKARNEYVFLDKWGYKAWIGLFFLTLPSLYYIFVHQQQHKKLKNIILAIIVSSVVSTAFHYLMTTIIPNPSVIQLQLTRIWIFVYLSSALSIVAFFTQKKINLKFSTPLIILVLVVITPFYHKKWYYTQNSYWINVQKWINNNLGENCLFLTPFHHQGFRVYSKRAEVTEYKDGTLSFYSSEYAFKWREMAKDISGWEKLNIDQLNTLKDKYNFSYLVTLSENTIPLESIYNDGVYEVVKIPEITKDCKTSIY